ncbi:MAG: AprM [Parcubacteria group bacterium GW2011_GWA2_43_9b]|uniref:Glycosyl transferase family 1 domain-containing protein n=1 Tax=Candidatus Portnoybacteria bacterium RIFCSPLOWO2_02_FULL_39_11 TaxID=1802001 RepID=A0A1G2FR12_9BACT|nr:MAG: AprM [Parcubacteria group bacterium GW2011_GWA2_43_9b]OGZ39961.1 MAG: hypothetical protein A3B04_02100 [Candidatus Portnoybacteria bacterium RIFCSPLOWO2_02_FULL_39_11]
MMIGINAAAAVKQPRTGVEEYTYQLIKHLTMLTEAREHRFLLYLPVEARRMKAGETEVIVNLSTSFRSAQGISPEQASRSRAAGASKANLFDFPLPLNFEIKILRWPLPFLWTQIRLAWEMWRRKPDVLFIPVHILPFGAPKNSVATIHGLEYEYFPKDYSLWRRLYLRWSTKRAARRAKKLIAVSESTKNDLIKFYGADAGKIEVVYHGVNFSNPSLPLLNLRGGEIHPNPPFQKEGEISPLNLRGSEGELCKPYILYIGRIETKKNIQGILETYKILKEQYNIPHELILAGAPGYGYDNLKFKIANLKLKITEIGYIDEATKWQLFSKADVFLFPSFYEGFGLPVLEAQSAGVPVVISYNSSLPEIAGEGALFVNPLNPAQIAEAVKSIIDDKILRDRLIKLGFENVKRFSWEKCARETLDTLLNYKSFTNITNKNL